MKIQTVKGIYESNTFIAETNNTIIIVDAGAALKDLLAILENRRPNAILLTHEHFDHVFHIADYYREFGCPVYCHSATLRELENDEFNSRFGKVQKPESFKNFKPLDKDCTFEINNLSIKAITCPGHSHGSICYLTADTLFTGDVLFKGVIGRTDLIPNGDALMQQTLKKLLKLFQTLKFETALHGHGRNSTHEHQLVNIANYIN